ncbi:hypothetical protein L209DRAFT_748322 [Thermothelomyces heterothallicus CBS 203.75]
MPTGVIRLGASGFLACLFTVRTGLTEDCRLPRVDRELHIVRYPKTAMPVWHDPLVVSSPRGLPSRSSDATQFGSDDWMLGPTPKGTLCGASLDGKSPSIQGHPQPPCLAMTTGAGLKLEEEALNITCHRKSFFLRPQPLNDMAARGLPTLLYAAGMDQEPWHGKTPGPSCGSVRSSCRGRARFSIFSFPFFFFIRLFFLFFFIF